MLLGHDVHIKLQMHCLNPQSDKSTCGQKFLLQCQGKVKFPRNKMCSTNMIYLLLLKKKVDTIRFHCSNSLKPEFYRVGLLKLFGAIHVGTLF